MGEFLQKVQDFDIDKVLQALYAKFPTYKNDKTFSKANIYNMKLYDVMQMFDKTEKTYK